MTDSQHHPANSNSASGSGEPLPSLASLQAELDARIHENVWLRQKYEGRIQALGDERDHIAGQLAEALEQVRRLTASQGRVQPSPDVEQRAAELEINHAGLLEEMEKLRKELNLHKAASEKYLARIYELKAAQKNEGPATPPPSA